MEHEEKLFPATLMPDRDWWQTLSNLSAQYPRYGCTIALALEGISN